MTNELFDGIFGSTSVGAATDDRAIVDALCTAETALARACAGAGIVPLAVALEIGAVCEAVRRLDSDELARRSVADGNPVIPLVAEIRARVGVRAGADAAQAVHLGATSQDILDTALMLVSKQALAVMLGDLGECASAAAQLARAHRETPMAGRTLLQQAVPTTFGALAATWGSGLEHAIIRLRAVRETLPAQLGGAAGTLAPLYPHGAAVLAAFADECDLAEPDGVWHTDRGVIADLAGALGTAGAAIGKVATDLVLLAQTEIGEVRERAPGGSSAMAHKQNPIAAITARAAAAQAPGLVATLLAAVPELQRGAGSWHAEWPALLSLLRYTGGAASRLWTALDLDVDTEAMARNLARLDGTLDTTDLGHARELVDRYLERRTG
ncbi:MAG: lyase family protein [Jatrophihabitantaceae bacterium]